MKEIILAILVLCLQPAMGNVDHVPCINQINAIKYNGDMYIALDINAPARYSDTPDNFLIKMEGSDGKEFAFPIDICMNNANNTEFGPQSCHSQTLDTLSLSDSAVPDHIVKISLIGRTGNETTVVENIALSPSLNKSDLQQTDNERDSIAYRVRTVERKPWSIWNIWNTNTDAVATRFDDTKNNLYLVPQHIQVQVSHTGGINMPISINIPAAATGNINATE